MSKASDYILDYTKRCSNKVADTGFYNPESDKEEFVYCPWLTPDQARKAVEIAREEIYEWIKNNAYSYTWCDYLQHERGMEIGKLIDDLKQAMKDE